MAQARTKTIAAFTAKLLAPLPDDVEQVDSAEFRTALARDAKTVEQAKRARLSDAWQRALFALKVAKADHTATVYRHLLAEGPGKEGPDEERSRMIYSDAIRNLLLTPAPGKTQLSWKLAHQKHHKDDDGVAEAIAADAARFDAKGA